MKSAPVIIGVLEGENAVQRVRDMCGATDPAQAAPGTIRKDFASNIQENIIHTSDSAETAKAEVERFFKPKEIFEW